MPRPAWYLAPFILWLGLADWLAECAGVSHAEALAEAKDAVRRKGWSALHALGIGAILFVLLILGTVHVGAPGARYLASEVSPSAVLPISMVIATLATAALTLLAFRALERVLIRTYARGLRVWQRRHSLYGA